MTRVGPFSTLMNRFRAIPLARRIVLLTIGLLILVHGANALFVIHYYTAISVRERDARNAKATLLAEHASRTMSAVDLSLETIAETLRTRLPLNKPTIFAQILLDKHIKRLPQVRSLAVSDPDGRIINTTRSFPPPSINISDRDYFSEQKKWRGVGLYINNIEISEVDSKPFIPMSRPIVDNDGNFRGIISATADPSYFANFYGPNGLDQNEIALLERADDGAVLAGTGLSDEYRTGFDQNAAAASAHSNLVVTTREIPGFPAKIVLVGKPTMASPQFITFITMDFGLLIVMTVIACWLAAAAARESAAVDREARARRTAEARLLSAIESAPAGFALYDPQDRLVLSNQLYRSFFDRIKELIVPGAAFEDLVRAAVSRNVYADVGNSRAIDYPRWRLDKHRAGGEELAIKLGDGRWILTRERRTKEDDIVCFFSDITPLKQNEEALRRSEESANVARQHAEQADQAKTSFLANMSHELRTPLNAIIGFAEMTEQQVMGPLSHTYQQYGEIIRTSGQHLLSIINDILDIAKLNSGKTVLHLESVNAAQIIADAVSIISQKAASAKVQLEVDVQPGCPNIEADSIRMRQVLLNLLTNAIKFTPRGGRIDVSMRLGDDGLRIVIKDTGVGMAAEDIPRALEPFTQVAKGPASTQEGTGLGLPISKTLVELHGGRFEITSAPMCGTTVTLSFPAAPHVAKTTEPPMSISV